MGFIRQQQIKMTMQFLKWQYQKQAMPVPPDAELQKLAASLVTRAGQIARQRGQNILAILKELVADIRHNR